MSSAARSLVLCVVGFAAACTGQPQTSPGTSAAPTPDARPTATPAATEEPTPDAAPSIELVGSAPVVRPTDLGDYGAALAATYFLDDATHHAYVVGFDDTPGGGQRVFHLS